MKTSAEKGLAAFAAHTHARGQDGGSEEEESEEMICIQWKEPDTGD